MENEIREEIKRSYENYPAFHSNHEGWAVIKEELDELWDCIKGSKLVTADDRMRKEAIQVAAMAIRFVEDLYHG